MYKVFIKQKVIYLTSEVYEKNNTWFHPFENIERMMEAISLFEDSDLFEGLNIIHNPVEELWDIFRANYKIIQAAGGLILNSKSEYLFIYRYNRWDLPKGKMEKNENIEDTAIREVKEECGINEVTITKKIKTTFHIYKEKGKHILKETHWYEMRCGDSEILTPQLEENITKVCWLHSDQMDMVLQNTYGSIKEIIFDTILNHNTADR